MTAAPVLPDIRVVEHSPSHVVRDFFEHDRLLSAYALADLDPANVESARWWVARSAGEVVGAALLVEIMPFRPCFAMGRSEAIAEIFRHGIRESRLIVAAPPPARPAIESTYRFERVDLMVRMAVRAESFKPRLTHEVTRLGTGQIGDIVDLYGDVSRPYFTPERLEREIYMGLYAAGELVAAAGTHVRSAEVGIAAVGNVLTRIAYRGRGMATSVTSAVTEAALDEHRDVVLNVRIDNAPAIAVYEHLGYERHAQFIEGPAVRRAPWERITNGVWRRR